MIGCIDPAGTVGRLGGSSAVWMAGIRKIHRDATIGSGPPGVAGAVPRRSARGGGGVARPGSPARCSSARRGGCADWGLWWCRIAIRPRQNAADPRCRKLERKTRFLGKPHSKVHSAPELRAATTPACLCGWERELRAASARLLLLTRGGLLVWAHLAPWAAWGLRRSLAAPGVCSCRGIAALLAPRWQPYCCSSKMQPGSASGLRRTPKKRNRRPMISQGTPAAAMLTIILLGSISSSPKLYPTQSRNVKFTSQLVKNTEVLNERTLYRCLRGLTGRV